LFGAAEIDKRRDDDEIGIRNRTLDALSSGNERLSVRLHGSDRGNAETDGVLVGDTQLLAPTACGVVHWRQSLAANPADGEVQKKARKSGAKPLESLQ
jgi:hypothetical protein